MPLVGYSSESSDEEPVSKKRKVTQDLPPLPATFRDLYATPVRASKTDDPSLHGGRQRVTPHVEGNWPTHVYTEWNPSSQDQEALEQLVKLNSRKGTELQSFLRTDLGAAAPLHISLSRSLGLQAEQRNDFEVSLRSSIEATGVRSFEVPSASLEWVPNYTRNRWFLILRLERPREDELNRLLKATNKVAASFDQPGLYTNEPPRNSKSQRIDAPPGPGETNVSRSESGESKADPFHVSIAWSLSEPESLASDEGQAFRALKVPVKAVKAKIGNNMVVCPLKPSIASKPDAK